MSEPQECPVSIDIGEPDFPRRAFDHYAALRAADPVHRALFTEPGRNGTTGAFLDRPLWAVTGYDAATAALLDLRFSVDPRGAPTRGRGPASRR